MDPTGGALWRGVRHPAVNRPTDAPTPHVIVMLAFAEISSGVRSGKRESWTHESAAYMRYERLEER